MIRKALFDEITIIDKLAIKTRKHMQSLGLKQWMGNYPDYDAFLKDYEKGGLYVFLQDSNIYGSISILPENDLPYKELVWQKDNSLVIHRLIVDPDQQKSGIGTSLFKHAIELAKENGYESIKVDTHPDNIKMQNLIIKMGFVHIGFLESIYRIAYELVIK